MVQELEPLFKERLRMSLESTGILGTIKKVKGGIKIETLQCLTLSKPRGNEGVEGSDYGSKRRMEQERLKENFRFLIF